MPFSGMTRRWLITIVVAIIAVLIAVWLYTTYAANEVEPEVAEDEVALIAWR